MVEPLTSPDDATPQSRWPRWRRRTLAMPLRPLGWGVVVAVGLILAETLVYLYLDLEGVAGALLVFLPWALVANVLAVHARRRAADAERRRGEADALAEQQVALCRVATLVARGADLTDVYSVTVTEVARGLDVEHVTLILFDEGGQCTVLATHDLRGRETLLVGERLPLDDASVDDYPGVAGTMATRMNGLGLRSGVGVPITIDDDARGALIVGSLNATPMPRETGSRIGEFADLLSTAIANAQTWAELKASRARIVVAADHARRGFEHDLRDGAQQRIVALGLGLRTIEASVPIEELAVRKQLDNVINGMADLYTDLQEISRSIHPAILSRGGLGPAVRALAKRSVLPVSVDVDVQDRLPESLEMAAYFVVAAALTNAAKHSRASVAKIHVALVTDELRIEVGDDGVGGATSAVGGSVLVGIRDRVDAVSGQLDVSRPPGRGTTLTVRIPR